MRELHGSASNRSSRRAAVMLCLWPGVTVTGKRRSAQSWRGCSPQQHGVLPRRQRREVVRLGNECPPRAQTHFLGTGVAGGAADHPQRLSAARSLQRRDETPSNDSGQQTRPCQPRQGPPGEWRRLKRVPVRRGQSACKQLPPPPSPPLTRGCRPHRFPAKGLPPATPRSRRRRRPGVLGWWSWRWPSAPPPRTPRCAAHR